VERQREHSAVLRTAGWSPAGDAVVHSRCDNILKVCGSIDLLSRGCVRWKAGAEDGRVDPCRLQVRDCAHTC
jgi:hypothetical protein